MTQPTKPGYYWARWPYAENKWKLIHVYREGKKLLYMRYVNCIYSIPDEGAEWIGPIKFIPAKPKE